MIKRDRLELIYDILMIIKENGNSIKPTPLLRCSNLSFSSFNQYEKELIKKEFIRKFEDKKDKKYYSLTDKGFNYLEKYRFIIKFIEDFELK